MIINNSNHISFTAQTRMSGLDMQDGTRIRKGAYDTIKKRVLLKVMLSQQTWNN